MIERNASYNDIVSVVKKANFMTLDNERKKDILSVFDESETGIMNFFYTSDIKSGIPSIGCYQGVSVYYGSLYEIIGNPLYEIPRVHLIVRKGNEYLLEFKGLSFVPCLKRTELVLSPLRFFINTIYSHFNKLGVSSDNVIAVRDVGVIDGLLFKELIFLVDVDCNVLLNKAWGDEELLLGAVSEEPSVIKSGVNLFLNLRSNFLQIQKEF